MTGATMTSLPQFVRRVRKNLSASLEEDERMSQKTSGSSVIIQLMKV